MKLFEESLSYLKSADFWIENKHYNSFTAVKNNIYIETKDLDPIPRLLLKIIVNDETVFIGEVESTHEIDILAKQLNLAKKEITSKSILVREFKEETDLYIFGGYFSEVSPTIAIDDDEACLDIIDNSDESRKCNINCGSGCAYILTPEELKRAASSIEDAGCGEYVFIEDFKGKICVEINKGRDLCFKDCVNLCEDLLYRSIVSPFGESLGYAECALVLHPESTLFMYEPQSTRAIENLFL